MIQSHPFYKAVCSAVCHYEKGRSMLYWYTVPIEVDSTFSGVAVELVFLSRELSSYKEKSIMNLA